MKLYLYYFCTMPHNTDVIITSLQNKDVKL